MASHPPPVHCIDCLHRRRVLAGPLRNMTHCALQSKAIYMNPHLGRACSDFVEGEPPAEPPQRAPRSRQHHDPE